MKRYKEMVHTATICAFNPMIDDFLNARFFLGDSYGRQQVAAMTAPAPGTAASTSSRLAVDPEDHSAAQVAGGGDQADSGRLSDATREPFSVGASNAAIVQPDASSSATAAAEAAAEASRLRQLRLKDQQIRQLIKPVMPDLAGLPPWAQEKLKQRQEVMQRQSDEHHASVLDRTETGVGMGKKSEDRTDRGDP